MFPRIAATYAAPAGATLGGQISFCFGMISGWRIEADGERRALCLATDAFAARFTLEGRAPDFRLVGFERRPDGACAGPGSRS